MKKVLIAAAGTGGHLIPAIEIADCFKSQGYQVLFICTGRPVEMQILNKSGYQTKKIRAVGLSKRGVLGFLEFACKLPLTIWDSFKVICSYKPQIVVGIGGYSSAFPLLFARLFGKKTAICELEKNFGLANHFISFFTDQIFSVHGTIKGAIQINKIIRKPFFEITKLSTNLPKKILVLGGSQGARALDEQMIKNIDLLAKNQIVVCHQSRSESLTKLKAIYQENKISAEVLNFIDKPWEKIEWSDLVISRSGAGAVAELSVAGRPCLLVPLPAAVEQLENAATMTKQGKAIYCEEGPNFEENFRSQLISLLEGDLFADLKANFDLATSGSGAQDLVERLIS